MDWHCTDSWWLRYSHEPGCYDAAESFLWITLWNLGFNNSDARRLASGEL